MKDKVFNKIFQMNARLFAFIVGFGSLSLYTKFNCFFDLGCRIRLTPRAIQKSSVLGVSEPRTGTKQWCLRLLELLL